jgi:hypothetical protein
MKKLFLLLAFTILTVSLLATPKEAKAGNWELPQCPSGTHGFWPICFPNSSPTPTPTLTPTVTPTATPVPTEEPCFELQGEVVVPCEEETPEPSATPEQTPEVTKGFAPSGAPQAPLCVAPVWPPTVAYDGQKGTTFSYHWTTVKEGLHTYWVDFGPTKDWLPYSMVVHGESVSITMYGWSTNWMRVAGYDTGCRGPFSEIVN